MIKSFEQFINEDYFSKLASRKDKGIVRIENEITEDFVRSFTRDVFVDRIKSITIRKENGKIVVDIDGDFYLKKDIEQIPFQFGIVTGVFSCSECVNLTSLEGCPKEVGGYFKCSGCKKLTSLEGCPKEVSGSFLCLQCVNLTSLEGCPEKVGGDFYCSHCANLTSIEGCPKEVSRDFNCEDCGKQFTEQEVKSLCNVKRKIFI